MAQRWMPSKTMIMSLHMRIRMQTGCLSLITQRSMELIPNGVVILITWGYCCSVRLKYTTVLRKLVTTMTSSLGMFSLQCQLKELLIKYVCSSLRIQMVV